MSVRVEFKDTGGAQGGTSVHGVEVDKLVREYMVRHGEKSYFKALQQVAKSHPDAAKKYGELNLEGSRDPVQVDGDAADDSDESSRTDQHRRDVHDIKYKRRMENLGDSYKNLPKEWPQEMAKAMIDRGNAGAEIQRRILELQRKYPGLDWDGAMSAVCADDPALAQAYRAVLGNVDYQDINELWSGSGGSRVSGSGNEKGSG
jgi:hypothetical protein